MALQKLENRWKGYDISYCQPKVNWDKVKADFIIIKAGEGTFKDKYFESHYENAKKRGIPVGAYFYSHATTVDVARQEAARFAAILKGKQFEMPVFLDIEAKETTKIPKSQFSAIIAAFCEEMEKYGYWTGLYHSLCDTEARVSESIRTRYCFWLAWWLGPNGNPFNRYKLPVGLWQYGVEKNKEAFNGDVDADYCYYDYPTEIKKRGLNGFAAQPEPTPSYPVLKKGDKGDAVKEMQELLIKKGYLREGENDGSFGKITLGGLLAFQFENSLAVDGICNEDDWKKLRA